MRDFNVRGTRNVFESARAAGASKVVYVSSGVAYGAHPDNDVPLTEESPLRANPDFPWADYDIEDIRKGPTVLVRERNAVPFEANGGWKEGDLLPQYVVSREDAKGSAADNNNVKGVWKDGVWTVAFRGGGNEGQMIGRITGASFSGDWKSKMANGTFDLTRSTKKR